MAKLRFKHGTMNSSKSAQLIMVDYNYKSQGKSTLVFKPRLDTRDGGIVKSRALGTVVEAILIDSDDSYTMTNLAGTFKPDCILVDEVQFMSPHQIDELAMIVDTLDIPVICFGLMTDFQSKLFEGSKRLIELGAILEEIKTVCTECKARAVNNMRLRDGVPIFDGAQVEVGGNEMYKPVCRQCYKVAQLKYATNS